MKRITFTIALIILTLNVFSQEEKTRKLSDSGHGYIILNGYDYADFQTAKSLLVQPDYHFFGFQDSLDFLLKTGGSRFYSRILFADVNLKESLIFYKAGLSKKPDLSEPKLELIHNFLYSCNLDTPNTKSELVETIHPVYFEKNIGYNYGGFLIIIEQDMLHNITPNENYDFYNFSYIDRIIKDQISSNGKLVVFLYLNYYFGATTETLLFVRYFDKLNFGKIIQWGAQFSSLLELKPH